MKKLLITLCSWIALHATANAQAPQWWTRIGEKQAPGTEQQAAIAYTAITANENELWTRLTAGGAQPQLFEVPAPDGSSRTFRIWPSALIPAELAAKYPHTRTWTGVATDDPTVTAKFDFTAFGFHAMVLDGGKPYFIDRQNRNTGDAYSVHYKSTNTATEAHKRQCTVLHNGQQDAPSNAPAARTSNGHNLRTYRVAIGCSHQYAAAATGSSAPTKEQALGCIVTTLNRINGVYEHELSVTMTLVPQEDTMIFIYGVGDPFSNHNLEVGSLLQDNQTVCDSLVGTANYDIGHVFCTGDGGYSMLGVVCKPGEKARSATGRAFPVGDDFDIDYVAHEMGHEFGADHPFNDNSTGACGGNAVPGFKFEPGSGSTIMAYAGICSPDNIQPHSDPYFGGPNLAQIQNYITVKEGSICPSVTSTGNKLVYLPSFATAYTIPYLTPFELTAPVAQDSVGDTSITYCWEQWDTGDGRTFKATREIGPLFRSYTPTKSTTRVFPTPKLMLAGILNNAGNDNVQGEKVPDTARSLSFRLTVRNILNGKGAFLTPDDSIKLYAVETGTGKGFSVTSQANLLTTYRGGSGQMVTWDMANTDKAPVSTPDVDIYFSVDGGYNWPYFLGTFPNNGAAMVTIPNPDTTTAHGRIKVKGHENVFLNVNKYDFVVIHSDTSDHNVYIYPSPAHTIVHVYPGTTDDCDAAIFDAIGRLIWHAHFRGQLDLEVAAWARGVYLLHMVDASKRKTVKKFVVQ